MTNRAFNIFSIILILVWIWADRYLNIGAPAYGWLLLLYVSVLFCGSYFIRMGFFMKSVCSAKTNEKIIALSFDDGPVTEKTAVILDILKEHQTEAAFFCIGKNMMANDSVLKRIPQEGHIIGNHSFSHHHFFSLFGPRRMLQEMQATSRISKNSTGLSPRFFRPPYGVTNPHLRKAVVSGGFISIGWSIRSFDTIIKNESRLINRVLNRLKPGAILLLHESPEITIRILPQLLKNIREKGYRIVRLDKMINLNPYD